MRSSSLFLLGVAGTVLAHGDHAAVGQKPIVDDSANWMTKHMAGTLSHSVPCLSPPLAQGLTKVEEGQPL